MMRTDGPTMLVLTRQNLPILDRAKFSGAEGVLKGAYVLSKEKHSAPNLILIATGSEVPLVLAAQEQLASAGMDARVVSMPSWEMVGATPTSYRDQVLPPKMGARLAVEAGS